MLEYLKAFGGFALSALRPVRKSEAAHGWYQLAISLALILGLPVSQYLAQPTILGPAEAFGVGALVFAVFLLIEGGRQRLILNQVSGTTARLDILLLPYDETEVDFTPGLLWRVVVVNRTPNTLASNVVVSMASSKPRLMLSLPVTLHRMHDNEAPYELRHALRAGEELTFDVLGCGQRDPPMFYLYRADIDRSEQTTYEWMLSEHDNQLIEQAATLNGWCFEIRVVADPPTAPVSKWFKLSMPRERDEWPSLSEINHERLA